MSAVDDKIRTNVYLNRVMKKEAQEIFKQYGLGLSEAFNIFLTQSVLERGIPFEIKIPNKETQKVLKNIQNDKNIESISLDELKEEALQCLS